MNNANKQRTTNNPQPSLILLFHLLLLSLPLPAQAPPEAEEAAEDYQQSQETEEEADVDPDLEMLEFYREHPLDLNRASEGELRELHLLSDRQILGLLQYRALAGDLIAIYELQAVPELDMNAIGRILPFVTVKGDLDRYRVPLPAMISGGQNELSLRWSRFLEPQKGYLPPEPGSDAGRYLGDPNQLLLRLRHTFANRLSFGLSAEKDRGEEFFRGSNSGGFDFYSAHFYLRDYTRALRALAIGDYQVSMGQGLLLSGGFSYGKGAAAASIKRAGRSIRPATAANEAAFLRGVAATFAFGKTWELTAFISRRRRDGNLLEPDTLDSGEILQNFSSLDLDGLHRTPAELADERVLRHLSAGGSLRYRGRTAQLAFNTLSDHFSRALVRRREPYNLFYFSGKRALNASLDYSFVLKNIHLFGETATDRKGRLATVNGVLIGLDRKADLAAVFRHYPRDYEALNANPFGETSGGRNETGFYLGLEVRPSLRWTLNAYFDLWRHPWLRFQVDAPSTGHEFRARLTFALRRRLRAYLELSDQTREGNAPQDSYPINRLIPYRLFQTRLHIAPQITKALELRTRVDWGFSRNPAQGRRFGFSALQDVLFRPVGFPLSFTGRFAIFDSEGYDIRFYHYENDLLFASSIPAYYHRGSRFYLNVRCHPTRQLMLEFRFAQTFWADQTTIGSALEEIAGQVRTQLGAQLRYRFTLPGTTHKP